MHRFLSWLYGLFDRRRLKRDIAWTQQYFNSFDDASEPIEPVKPPQVPLTDITVAYPELRELAKLGKKVVEYPPVRDQSTRDWVTERLQNLTGGLTRHPADLTQYPTPPSEADLAARDYYGQSNIPRGLFTHGYSMDYLNALLRRADMHDLTLTAEELMSLRARGLA